MRLPPDSHGLLSRRPKPILVAVVLCAALLLSPNLSCAAGEREGLHIHLEADAGATLLSEGADRSLNPASVIKVATTEWALAVLGPDHRFETRFGYSGSFDRERGRIDGDLLVSGGADPDFHIENAYLVARALNEAGVRQVTGDLVVDAGFWIGWEGGSEKREHDPGKRATLMAERLRVALDPDSWSPAQQRGVDEFLARRSWTGTAPPRVAVEGDAVYRPGKLDSSALVVHASNPLVKILKRFNSYSNNDIERLGEHLGSAADLEQRLRQGWGATAQSIELSTLSGLGVNRISPRNMVRLLRDLDRTAVAAGIALVDVLPVAGCDPGTLSHFPEFDEGPASRALVGKTGSLNSTDGGVAVLAGRLDTSGGRLWFCLATTGAGGKLAASRAEQERWVVDRIGESGGPRPFDCATPLVYSDDDARVTAADGRR